MPLWCNGSTDPFQGSSLGSEPGRGNILYFCKHCKQPVYVKYGSNIFCSKRCSNSRVFSFETKLKKSIKAKNFLKKNGVWGALLRNRKKKKIKKSCLYCNSAMELLPCHSFKRWCNNICCRAYLKQKKLVGGYRPGSGRSIKGYYRGIYCGSTYELVYLIYCLDNNIPIQRFKGYLQLDNLKYIPDFLINSNTIIEIKGMYDKKIEYKKALACKNGFYIKVLYKHDLKPCFEYITQKYKTKKYYTLYDRYYSKHI